MGRACVVDIPRGVDVQFTQVIEFRTSDIGAFTAALDEWLASTGTERAATRAILCEDRDEPGRWVQVVEFPSYEAAMANSNDPRTTEFARRLSSMCDDGPTFRNLDLHETYQM